MAKRRSKKQILAAKAQAERMQKYWEMKRAEEHGKAKQVGDHIDKMKVVKSYLSMVYLAGWKQNKAENINIAVDGQMSVKQAYDAIYQLFNPIHDNQE